MPSFFDLVGQKTVAGKKSFFDIIEGDEDTPKGVSYADLNLIKPEKPKNKEYDYSTGKPKFKGLDMSGELDLDKNRANIATSAAQGFLKAASPFSKEEDIELIFPSNNNIAEILGSLAGYSIPFGAISKIPAIANLARGTTKLPTAARLGASALRGAGELGIYETAKQSFQDKPLSEKLAEIGKASATGAVISPAFEAGGMAIKGIEDIFAGRAAKKAVPEAKTALSDFLSMRAEDQAKGIATIKKGLQGQPRQLPSRASGINFTMPGKPQLAPMPPTVPSMALGPERQLIGNAIRLPAKAGEVPTEILKQASQARQKALKIKPFGKLGITSTQGETDLQGVTKNLPGFAFGIEPNYDEEGKIKGYKYNVGKGVMGFMAMGAARGLSGKMGITAGGQEAPNRKPINVSMYNIQSEAKKALQEAAKDAGLERSKGVLRNKTVEAIAKEADLLKKAYTVDKTAQEAAQILASRQNLAALQSLTKNKGITPEEVKMIKTISDAATHHARVLQSAGIQVDPVMHDAEMAVNKNELIKKLLKIGIDADDIVKKAEGVDFNNVNEVTKYYRSFVKPKLAELVDEYRYINMLSSPRTHIVNAFSNLVQTSTVSPATRLVDGTFDAIGASLTGRARKVYASEVPAYYKGMINAIPKAIKDASKALKGEIPLNRPDIERLPTGNKILDKFRIVPQALEAGDILFRTLIKEGEKQALALRAIKQNGKLTRDVIGKIDQEAAEKAAYYIFRKPLDAANKTGQGAVLSGIDKATSAVYSLRKIPGVKWFVPFVQTPMNILKQGIEYSPAGFSTMIGAANKQEQAAKATVGSLVMLGAGFAAMTGNTTWKVPTNKNEKELFYASGRRPYAVRIGDKWVGYSKLGPLAYPMAMAAAIKYYFEENPKATTETVEKRLLNTLGGVAGFFSDQSYMQGMNDWIQTMTGDPQALTQMMANVPSQLIPLSSLQRWVNSIVDPVYRRPDKEFSVQKILQGMGKSMVGFSRMVPAIEDYKGEPQKRDLPLINAFSPLDIGIGKPEDEARLKDVQLAQKINAESAYAGEQNKKKMLEYIEQLKNMTSDQRRKALGMLSVEDIKAISKHLNVDSPDIKAIKSLNAKEKAQFIKNKMATIKSDDEKRKYLIFLNKEGVLNDTVIRQLMIGAGSQ